MDLITPRSSLRTKNHKRTDQERNSPFDPQKVNLDLGESRIQVRSAIVERSACHVQKLSPETAPVHRVSNLLSTALKLRVMMYWTLMRRQMCQIMVLGVRCSHPRLRWADTAAFADDRKQSPQVAYGSLLFGSEESQFVQGSSIDDGRSERHREGATLRTTNG